ncbi:hypothetical protein ACNOYE_36245 [Nannocystaceae bacterium ST9]
MKSLPRLLRLLCLPVIGLGLVFAPGSARAWDPSTTHQGMLEAGATRSALQVRWMDASELERGLFSDLRVDPDRLAPDERRVLELAMHVAHADVGARPLGGPGSCPSADSPPSTQLFCVDQDLWEQPALGWLKLGMVAEVTPVARQVHHFLDRETPTSPTWSDPELPASTLRQRQARANGEPLAGVLTSTNFAGQSSSAIAWFEDTRDPLAPTQTFAHLELASTATSRAERDHHLALALIGVGALLHVVQDLGVPAHARGDATAFFSPLSPALGDRGLPLQEFVRFEYGRRDLPGVGKGIPTTPPTGIPLSSTLIGHVLGDADYEGLATQASQRYFSESSLPPPRFLELDMSAREAATTLLGEQPSIDPVELDGATLSPWPADRGYLLSPTGRALSAFDTDLEGRIRLYLDEAVYREQAYALIPETVDVTRSLLDLIWPAWPTMQRSTSAATLAIPATWTGGRVLAFVETERGERTLHSEVAIVPDADLRIPLPVVGEGERALLVVIATREPGPPIVLEHVVAGGSGEALPDESGPAPIEPVPL